MNLVVVKYCLLIGAILASTAVVTGPLNPQTLFSDPKNGELAADSIYQFGSDAFYKEINQSGNEYMKSGTEGYSQALLPTDKMEQTYRERWNTGVTLFKTGYKGCVGALFELAAVPQMTDRDEKVAVCKGMRVSRNEMVRSLDILTEAKASATPGSSQGFTIGMAMPRIEQINAEAEDAEIACMQAVVADLDHDPDGFARNLQDVSDHVREMRRIYPELKVVSNDFDEN
jgi:hypothetical protein